MLKAENRLKDARVLRALFSKGKIIRSPFFLCKYFLTDSGVPHITVSVSTKISKKAVTRNRIKRRIREALRLQIEKCPPIDAVFFGSGKAEICDFEDLKKEVLRVFKSIK